MQHTCMHCLDTAAKDLSINMTDNLIQQSALYSEFPYLVRQACHALYMQDMANSSLVACIVECLYIV